MATESRFLTDRRKRIEEQRRRHPEIKPEPTSSVLKPDERLSGLPPAPPRNAVLSLGAEQTDWKNPIPESTAEEMVHSLPGPLRGAALGIGRGLQYLQEPPAHPGLSERQMSAPPQPPSQSPQKLADRAAVRAAADASVMAGRANEDPSGQGANQKPPAPSAGPSHVPGGVGTGAGAAGQTPARAAAPGTPNPTKTMVKLPDGRIVMTVGGGEALDPYRQGGGTNMSFQGSMAEQGLGKPQAERFMRDRTSGTMDRGAALPYSERVRGLAAEGSDVPLDFEGDSGFGLSPLGSGGPREGYRRLSGLEQATERRSWLEGRADTEQARELERTKAERQKREAELDPLELARIQAQGRMGGDVAKVQLDLRARQAAVAEHQQMSRQIEVAQARLAGASPEEAADLQKYIDYLIQTRREISNLLLGERLSDPRAAGDAFGAALAGLGLAGAGGAPITGAR